MTNIFSLEGKNAWITGASYGIGFNIAKAFVAAGIKTIIFNDINEAALERGLANYKEAGIENVKGYVCDVTDENAVKALVEKIHAEVGNIDILVNNAGIIKRIPMHEMKRAEFQQVIDVDLVAPYICSAAVIPEMMERREGKIINICSMMSELGRETVSAYAAAKGGLKMLTRNICSEYGEYNIQCNGIGPGYIATPQTAPLRERQPDGSRHPFDSFICAKTPAGRWLDPSELGGPAVFLASHASDAVNGHVLYVDDGADFAWGFSLRTPYAEELDVQVKPPVKRLPSRRCIHSAFRSAGKNAFTPRHLSFLLDFAKEQELKIAGNAMGTLVCSVREEGSDDLTGYFEVWLPVEDEAYEN